MVSRIESSFFIYKNFFVTENTQLQIVIQSTPSLDSRGSRFTSYMIIEQMQISFTSSDFNYFTFQLIIFWIRKYFGRPCLESGWTKTLDSFLNRYSFLLSASSLGHRVPMVVIHL